MKFEGFQGEIRQNEPLSKHTYYQIGGPCKALLQPKSWEDLGVIKEVIQKEKIPYFIMGKGSNLLVADNGFQGLVIKADKLNIEISEQSDILTTGSSVTVSSLLRRAGREGWGGLEFLTGVPGSIGGVVFMNAGTHLGEAKDKLLSIRCFDFDGKEALKEVAGSDLKYSYRQNHFLKSSQIVYSAQWKVEQRDPSSVQKEITEVLNRRKASQPLEAPSCGSVFKNPYDSGMRSWEVIDKLSTLR